VGNNALGTFEQRCQSLVFCYWPTIAMVLGCWYRAMATTAACQLLFWRIDVGDCGLVRKRRIWMNANLRTQHQNNDNNN